VKTAHLAALREAAASRRPVAYATRLPDGLAYVLPDEAAPEALVSEAAAMLAADRSGTVAIGSESWFVEARNPAPRLIVVGAVHIAQALVPLAVATGFAVVVVDPRRAFATEDRFPGVEISTEWPDEAIDRLGLDPRTAIVTLTHDPKLDDPALIRCLKSQVFYVGALGSRKTHASRLERLRAAGLSEPAMARIQAPIGLDIGAVTAPEIAVAIMAQVVAARRGKLAKA
jgi:xanthine dehydrogenase accessory factor